MSHWATFLKLPPPAKVGAYTVEKSANSVRVARGAHGTAALLIAFSHHASSTPRRLLNLSYAPPAFVELTSDGEQRIEQLAILECHTGDEELQKYFFSVVDAVLADQRAADNEGNFERALDKVVTLFRALRRPATRSIQGVWAELALICWSSKPSETISAWHSSPSALHDFANGDFKLEVKSSRSGLREHHFRLAQLSAIQTGSTIIASVLLTESGAGVSVHDLLQAIKQDANVTREARARVETILAETLGEDWYRAADIYFDMDRAKASLRFYQALAIPSIPQPLPSGIKDVQFVADLSNSQEQSVPELRKQAPFYAAVLPAR